MGWSIGFDSNWQRDIGYGVPSVCDHPDCNERIDRGLSYVCGGEPYGGDRGCGLYFCFKHQKGYVSRGHETIGSQLCERCYPRRKNPFKAKDDIPLWIYWKLTDYSWEEWRNENPEKVAQMQAVIDGLSSAQFESLKKVLDYENGV
jgi:hypothetical protein